MAGTCKASISSSSAMLHQNLIQTSVCNAFGCRTAPVTYSPETSLELNDTVEYAEPLLLVALLSSEVVTTLNAPVDCVTASLPTKTTGTVPVIFDS